MVIKKIVCESRQLKRTIMSCFFYFRVCQITLITVFLFLVIASSQAYAGDDYPSVRESVALDALNRPMAFDAVLQYRSMDSVWYFYNHYSASYDRYRLQDILNKYQGPFSRYNPDNFFRKYELEKQWKDMQKEFDALRKYLLQLSRIPPIKIMPLLK